MLNTDPDMGQTAQGRVTFYATKNSTYAVDEENNLIRRVSGNNPATSRFQPEGEWKEMVVAALGTGNRLWIQWPDDEYTYTSSVVATHGGQGVHA